MREYIFITAGLAYLVKVFKVADNRYSGKKYNFGCGV